MAINFAVGVFVFVAMDSQSFHSFSISRKKIGDIHESYVISDLEFVFPLKSENEKLFSEIIKISEIAFKLEHYPPSNLK